MSGKLPGLRKRLARVERTLANIAKGEELANCICLDSRSLTVAWPHQPEEFEAEMNRTCPVHGFRRLGMIVQVRSVHGDGTVEESAKLDQLLEIYEARQLPTKPRLSQLGRVACKLKHDSQEP